MYRIKLRNNEREGRQRIDTRKGRSEIRKRKKEKMAKGKGKGKEEEKNERIITGRYSKITSGAFYFIWK